MFRSIRKAVDKVGARVNNVAPGYVLTPLTKKVHQIEDPKEPSKATGHVLPWTPIEYVVDACGLCAVDEGTDGIELASSWHILADVPDRTKSSHHAVWNYRYRGGL